jgi:hypothetical protein
VGLGGAVQVDHDSADHHVFGRQLPDHGDQSWPQHPIRSAAQFRKPAEPSTGRSGQRDGGSYHTVRVEFLNGNLNMNYWTS